VVSKLVISQGSSQPLSDEHVIKLIPGLAVMRAGATKKRNIISWLACYGQNKNSVHRRLWAELANVPPQTHL
jgi:hypothetical protein